MKIGGAMDIPSTVSSLRVLMCGFRMSFPYIEMELPSSRSDRMVRINMSVAGRDGISGSGYAFTHAINIYWLRFGGSVLFVDVVEVIDA